MPFFPDVNRNPKRQRSDRLENMVTGLGQYVSGESAFVVWKGTSVKYVHK